jgi:hypothetical protein
MMIKLVKDHEGIVKIFPVHKMDGLGLRNITPNSLTILLGHTNFQMWNVNTVMMTQRFNGFNILFRENHLNDLGFEQIFAIEHQ